MTISITSPTNLITQQPLKMAKREVEESMARLATGKRINNSRDNVVDFAAQTRLNSEIRGLSQAIKNAGIGIAINDTAEAALSEITDAIYPYINMLFFMYSLILILIIIILILIILKKK